MDRVKVNDRTWLCGLVCLQVKLLEYISCFFLSFSCQASWRYSVEREIFLWSNFFTKHHFFFLRGFLCSGMLISDHS